MSKFKSPLKEIDHDIGVLYELSLRTNLQLTDTVHHLQVAVGNLMSAETQIKDIVMAQEAIDTKYRLLSNL